MKNNLKLLDKVINLSLEAGTLILKHYGSKDFEIKNDESPLTKADLESNKLIIEGLKNISDFKINSEESILTYNERKNLKYLWLVDPLDGTKDFLEKNDEFTINIALLENNIPILGLIYAPALNQLFYAYKNYGAYYKYNNNIEKLENKNDKNNNDLIALKSNFHNTSEIDIFLNKYNIKSKNLGSSLKFCALAQDYADIYPRFNGTKEWDTAAGDIILKESGGIILDKITKKPLIYNKENIKNNYFIAFSKNQINKKIYKDFMESKF